MRRLDFREWNAVDWTLAAFLVVVVLYWVRAVILWSL